MVTLGHQIIQQLWLCQCLHCILIIEWSLLDPETVNCCIVKWKLYSITSSVAWVFAQYYTFQFQSISLSLCLSHFLLIILSPMTFILFCFQHCSHRGVRNWDGSCCCVTRKAGKTTPQGSYQCSHPWTPWTPWNPPFHIGESHIDLPPPTVHTTLVLRWDGIIGMLAIQGGVPSWRQL